MTWAAIALGGNEGDVADTFRTAARQLQQAGCQLVRVADLFETRPVGDSAGPGYCNSVLTLQTSLSATDLLSLLQQVERQAGRRSGGHWRPRPLDLDLIAYGNVVCETAELTLPHPAAWYRQFVLAPLAQVAGDWVHPWRGVSIDALRRRFQRRPLRVGVTGTQDTLDELWSQASPFRRDQVELRKVDSPHALDAEPVDLLAWLGPTPAESSYEHSSQAQPGKNPASTPSGSNLAAVSRPSGETGDDRFQDWPVESRLNAAAWRARDPHWLRHLLQGLLDTPESRGPWWPGSPRG